VYQIKEVNEVAKAGMRRPGVSDPKNHGTESNKKAKFQKNEENPVQELQGKYKNARKKAKPL
jgi:hypothetical protein